MSYTTHEKDPKDPKSYPHGGETVRADSLESTPRAAAKLSTTGAKAYCTPETEKAECPKTESSKDCNLYKGTERKLCPARTPGLQLCVSRKSVDSQYSCSST